MLDNVLRPLHIEGFREGGEWGQNVELILIESMTTSAHSPT
jgi:hypothetical protein